MRQSNSEHLTLDRQHDSRRGGCKNHIDPHTQYHTLSHTLAHRHQFNLFIGCCFIGANPECSAINLVKCENCVCILPHAVHTHTRTHTDASGECATLVVCQTRIFIIKYRLVCGPNMEIAVKPNKSRKRVCNLF